MKSFIGIVCFLVAMTQGLQIQCNFYFNTYEFESVGPQVYSCSGTFVAYGDQSAVVSVNGDHMSGKSNANVEGLNIYNEVGLPRNIAQFFPNLKALELKKVGLKTISAADLQPFPQLMHFEAWGNKLTSLDSDLFKFNPKVQFIGLNENLIANVGANFFSYLPAVKQIQLLDNVCISSFAWTEKTWAKLKAELPILCPPLK